jgi:3,4-dihydroxy 2-butanone 4-phosphate synthase/GTP cyclohydrolase II
VRNLANGNVGASDFVRPGHVFPLIAREGGVLMRSGHTEAAVDLCKLSGLPPVGVISELVNDDGTVKRGPDVAAFAREHGLKQVSVADLIAYRQRQETLVQRVACSDIETIGGKAKAYTYTLPWDVMHHLAIVFGDIRDGHEVPVRLHSEDVVSDVFGTGHRLDAIMKAMGAEQRGVIVYLREGSVGVAHQDRNRPSGDREDHEEARRRESEWREIGLGAQILKDLGIASIRLIASRERHYIGLEGFGIHIASTEIL